MGCSEGPIEHTAGVDTTLPEGVEELAVNLDSSDTRLEISDVEANMDAMEDYSDIDMMSQEYSSYEAEADAAIVEAEAALSAAEAELYGSGY